MLKEKIGYVAYKLSAFLSIAGVVMLVWRRNKFLNFGVYLPTIKPSDVLFLIAFILAVIAFIFSENIRKNKERNDLFLYWLKRIVLLFVFFAIGYLWTIAVFGTTPNVSDAVVYGRIAIGTIVFLLLIFLGFNNFKYNRLIFLSFLSSLVLVPFIFFPEEWILNLLLVVSPAGYVFLGFQNNTIALGSLVLIPIILLFALFIENTSKRKYIYWLAATLLIAILLWSGSRAAWLGTFGGMLVILVAKFMNTRNKFLLYRGFAAISLAFLMGLIILPTLARNTALVRVFPHLKLPTEVSKEIMEKISLGAWQISFLRLPTWYFIQTNKLIADVDFKGGRGEVWLKYSFYFDIPPPLMPK